MKSITNLIYALLAEMNKERNYVLLNDANENTIENDFVANIILGCVIDIVLITYLTKTNVQLL